jgi:hypothetical protein
MISAAKLNTKRANARVGTGPTPAAGRARSARNARRHGLTIPVGKDSALTYQTEAITRAIAGEEAGPEALRLARTIAEAQLHLVRIRRAKSELTGQANSPIDLAATLDDYERRTLSRRNRAIQNFDCHRILEAASRR